MKLLTFSGTYSYSPKNSFSGLVCFCHFEKKDSSEKLKKAMEEIITVAGAQEIGLVPFSHLNENVMNIEDAKILFDELVRMVEMRTEKKAFVAPFAVTKELNLNVPSDDSAVRFFHF